MSEFRVDVIRKVGVLSTSAKGWTKELRLISWNGRPARFDLREWAPGDEKMGKGVTLSGEELIKLGELIDGLELETDRQEGNHWGLESVE